MKLDGIIRMCSYETYNKVRIVKNLSDTFPVQYGMKKGDALSPLLFNFASDYAIRRSKNLRMECN
jgi:hypothetical protein